MATVHWLGAALQLLFLFMQRVAAVPNILFLMADQHRFDAIGQGAHTPNLDALAVRGAQFMTHYTSTPSCTPARAAILTGRSPWRHGMLGYADSLAKKYPIEMPSMMAAAGLFTAVVGKDHFGWNKTSDAPIAHGFKHLEIYDGLGNGFPGGGEYDDYDRWFQRYKPSQSPLKSGNLGWNDWAGALYEYDEWFHPTAWTGRRAVTLVHELAGRGQPFFLKVSFHRPHSPYDPPARFLNATPSPKYHPAVSNGGWDEKFRHCSTSKKSDSCCGEVDAADLDFTRRAYLANIAFVDEQIGLILAALKESRMENNTFVLYTSDHGDMRNDHFLWRKSFPYEGSSHVPLMFSWPDSLRHLFGDKRGVKVKSVTELRDLLPTFLEVLGLWDTARETDLDGRPLSWPLRGEISKWRSWIDMEHNIYCWNNNHWNALTDGESKFIFHAASGRESFFNLSADPGETRDLADDKRYESVINQWRERMVHQFITEGRGPVWVKDGKLTRRMPCNFSPHWPGEGLHPCRSVIEEEAKAIMV